MTHSSLTIARTVLIRRDLPDQLADPATRCSTLRSGLHLALSLGLVLSLDVNLGLNLSLNLGLNLGLSLDVDLGLGLGNLLGLDGFEESTATRRESLLESSGGSDLCIGPDEDG